MSTGQECPVCLNTQTKEIFRTVVRHRHEAIVRFCEKCQFLFILDPKWLDEAYRQPITIQDTGILARNIALSKVTSIMLYFLFNRQGEFLDYSGGYGIFTRLMRDIGFDFYWCDPYATNLFARGFECVSGTSRFELITCFEVLEHLVDPVKEIGKMFDSSDSMLCTTTLLPSSIPRAHEWNYYGLEHGQHVSFYSSATLQFIARMFGCNLYSDGATTHLFTKRSLNPQFFRAILKLSRYGLFYYVRKRMNSRTEEDSESSISLNREDFHENSI